MIQIPLSKGQVALIDDTDWPLISGYKWYSRWDNNPRSFYAIANTKKPNGSKTTAQMHRLLLDAQPGQLVDHINHDTLDNRRCNIRICTLSQNGQNRRQQRNNTSGYRGVWLDKRYQKWRAQIKINGKQIALGGYDTPELAFAAYLAASAKYHDPAFRNTGDEECYMRLPL